MQEELTIEPYSLCIRAICIDEDRLDEEFLIARGLRCEELYPTLDDLLLRDVECGESRCDITLVFDITWKILDQLFGSFDSCFTEFFYIDVRGMEE